jgi:REP element-mobilizing transposase RayT
MGLIAIGARRSRAVAGSSAARILVIRPVVTLRSLRFGAAAWRLCVFSVTKAARALAAPPTPGDPGGAVLFQGSDPEVAPASVHEPMPRPKRIQFPGALYHITARGNNREPMYLDDLDREHFLRVLATTTRRYHALIHAYCLLTNHYHLLLETPLGNVSRALQYLNGVYCQRFNRRHGRNGHVLGARFAAQLIEREAHLLEAACYIVCNPVRAGLCAHPARWRWSSYRATAGLTPTPTFLLTRALLAEFAPDPTRARQRYRAFVTARLSATRPRTRRPRAEAA